MLLEFQCILYFFGVISFDTELKNYKGGIYPDTYSCVFTIDSLTWIIG